MPRGSGLAGCWALAFGILSVTRKVRHAGSAWPVRHLCGISAATLNPTPPIAKLSHVSESPKPQSITRSLKSPKSQSCPLTSKLILSRSKQQKRGHLELGACWLSRSWRDCRLLLLLLSQLAGTRRAFRDPRDPRDAPTASDQAVFNALPSSKTVC